MAGRILDDREVAALSVEAGAWQTSVREGTVHIAELPFGQETRRLLAEQIRSGQSFNDGEPSPVVHGSGPAVEDSL